VNNVDYIWYFVYTPVPSVNYCDGLGRCFPLVCIYACAAVFFHATVFSVNKDLYISCPALDNIIEAVGTRGRGLQEVERSELLLDRDGQTSTRTSPRTTRIAKYKVQYGIGDNTVWFAERKNCRPKGFLASTKFPGSYISKLSYARVHVTLLIRLVTTHPA